MPDGPRSGADVGARSKRLSQMAIQEQHDLCMDLTLRQLLFGSLAGFASALLMFQSPTKRWSAVAFGAGVGLGSAYADSMRVLGDKGLPTFSNQPPT